GVIIHYKDHMKPLDKEEDVAGALSGNISAPSPQPLIASVSAQLHQKNVVRIRIGGYHTFRVKNYNLPRVQGAGYGETKIDPRLRNLCAR
ncbi:hypothetical protein BG011_006680, partial [Mortierella polycephala]